MQASTTTDWKAKSTRYQAMSDQKLQLSASEITKAELSLKNTTAKNKASQAELDRAWGAFWSAKKYLNDAQLIQNSANELFHSQNYQDSYYKYKSSYGVTKKIDSTLVQLKGFLKKESKLQ